MKVGYTKTVLSRIGSLFLVLVLLVSSTGFTSSANGEVVSGESIVEEPQNLETGLDEGEEETPEEITSDETDFENQNTLEGEASEEEHPEGELEEEKPEEENLEEEELEEEELLEEEPEEEEIELDESITLEDVEVSVCADKGVFPAGAYVNVSKVSSETESEALEAVDELRDNSKNVAASYTFDITVFNEEGEEIEPDTSKGSVKVTFSMVEVSNSNLDVDVYHVEETNESYEATKLTDVAISGDELTASTDGFSLYTVEFTYGERQFVLEGDETVELTDILEEVGLTVENSIDEVTSTNADLVYPYLEEGIWYISAVRPFSSVESLYVTIDGIQYEIVVTDDNSSGSGGSSGTYKQVTGETAGLQENLINNPFTSGLTKAVTAYLADNPSKKVTDAKPSFSGTGEAYAVTVMYPKAYKYYDGYEYDVYVKIIPHKSGAGTWTTSVTNASSDSYYYIKLIPGATKTDFDYEVWLQDPETGNTVSNLALVGGSCFTSTNEGARPWSDDGKIYSNLECNLDWKGENNGYTPHASFDKASKYILGHGFAENGHIYGGFYCSKGEGEIVLGYLSRDLKIYTDSAKTESKAVTIPASDGYPIGERGVQAIKDKVRANEPSKTITGWKSSQELKIDNGDPIPAGQMIPDETLAHVVVKEGLTLELVSDPSYKVSFDYNYSGKPTDPSPITVFKNNPYGTLPSATREGFNFLGWYTAASGGNKIESTTTVSISADQTLYAHWKAIEYTITLKSSESTITFEPITRNYGDTYGIPDPTTAPTGYEFDGWYDASTGGTKINSDDLVTADKTLYAHWKAKTFTLTFDANKGTVSPASKTVTYDASYGELPTPTRIGYNFTGWFTTKTSGSEVRATDIFNFTDNQTIYAHWTAKTPTVTFEANGGAVSPTSKTVTYDSAYGDLPTPSRKGHTFKGWFTSSAGGDEVTKDTLVSNGENHTLYAKWEANKYTVTFEGNGGTVSEPTREVTFDATYGPLPTPTKTGYTFTGWYTDPDGGTKVEGSDTYENEGAQTLYAHWTPIERTLTFHPNGGAVSPTTKRVTYDRPYGDFPTPTYIGHSFDGWFTEQNGGTKTTSAMPVSKTENHTLYAHWTDENISASMDGYEYACDALPLPDTTLSSEEKAISTTKYYYVTTPISEGGTEWKDMTSTSLNVGTYYMYAVIKGNDNTTYTTQVDPFLVTPAPAFCTPPSDKGSAYTGTPQELINPPTNVVGGHVEYSLNGEDYSSEIPKGTEAKTYKVWYKVIPDGNHTGTEPAFVNASIGKNQRENINVVMTDYKYGQTDSVPQPHLDTTPDENPTVTYYYYPVGHPEDVKEWIGSETSKSLNSGEYVMYAVLGDTDNYASFTTPEITFTVLKGDYTISSPTAVYIYGEKIGAHEPVNGSAVADDTDRTAITGTFVWKDSEKTKEPKVSDSEDKDATIYVANFIPSSEFLNNYDPKDCDCLIIVLPKPFNSDTNVKLEKKDEGGQTTYEVTEKLTDEELGGGTTLDPELKPGIDYDVDVKRTENKDKNGNVIDIDYVITYTFKGNYSGEVIKRVKMPIPKPNPAGEHPQSNIIARVDREQNVIDDYNPRMETPDYEWAKKLVYDDFATKAGSSPSATAIKEKLDDPSSSQDIIYDANVVIEVKEPRQGEAEFDNDKPIADAFILENIKNAGEKIEYIDISMFTTYKLTDSMDTSKVYETNRSRIRDTGDNEEVITIKIPESIRTYPSNVERTYYIVRVHNSVSELLDATVENGNITFRTSKFSTYAIAYMDKVNPVPTPPSPGNDPIPDNSPVPLAVQPIVIAPKTGDTMEAIIFALMLLCGVAVICTGRNKKQEP